MLFQDVKLFLEEYAPCTVDNSKVVECLKDLCTQDNPILATTETGNYRWLPSIYASKDEYCALKGVGDLHPLQKIANSICATINHGIQLCPESRMASDVLEDSLIQGCFIDELSASPSISHADVIAPMLRMTENDDSWVISACRHIMDEDPRRMWIYSLAFEDDLVVGYYLSRVHSVRTHAFDYIEDPEILVRLVLSLVSASPHQLGLDPLVHKCADTRTEGLTTYVYEIPSIVAGAPAVFYKTGRCLYQERPTCVMGRATRVWEVSQVRSADDMFDLDPGNKAVLKDVWLDADAHTEDDNKNAIFKAVDDFVDTGLCTQFEHELTRNPGFERDPTSMERLMRQFINQHPLFQDFDEVLKDRVQDLLTDKKYRSLFLTTLHVWRSPTSYDNNVDAQHTNPITAYTDFSEKRKQLKESSLVVRRVSKRQTRFVYKEVCTDLRAVGSMGNLMKLLDQALDAIRVLYCAGWVHRDISKGNLLAFQDRGEWIVKLCDFEFSRRVDDGTPDPYPRIGTPSYMPHEILKGTYLLKEALGPNTEADSLAAHLKNVTAGSFEYERLKIFKKDFFMRFALLPTNAAIDVIPDELSVVHHNFQHDLESLWWLVLYFITVCVDHQKSKVWAEDIFQKSLTPSWQRTACFEQSFWGTARHCLHPSVTKPFGDFMEKLRTAMYREYIVRAGFGQLQQQESYSYIHAVFASEFKTLLEDDDSGWKDVLLSDYPAPVIPKTMPTRTKRAIAKTEALSCSKKSRFN